MQRPHRPTRLLVLLAFLALLAGACGDDSEEEAIPEEAPSTAEPAEAGEDEGVEGAGGDEVAEDPDGDVAAGESPFLEGAMEEGELNWYTAHYNLETAEAIADRFEETYPGITVNVYRETAQRINQRFVQEQEVGQTVADVLGITEISLVQSLADQGVLAEFTPTNIDELNPAYTVYNHPDDLYHVAAVGNNVICYNTDEVTEEEAPKTWEELLDPKWEGQIATGHPGASGYVGTWATYMYLTYGPEYFEQLAENDPLIGQSITDTIPRLAAGERLVAACSDQTAAQAAKAGDPIGIIYPEDGAVIMPTPNAIPVDAPHPEAARLFADFIVSEDTQTFLTEEQLVTPLIEDGIPLPEHVPEDATYVRPELVELTENLETVIGEWRRVFGV